MRELLFVLISAILTSQLFSQKLDSIEELINKEDYETIIDKFSTYETEIASYPDINYYLAIAYFKTGNYKKAETIFSELINKNYKIAQTYFNLGVTKYKLKKLKEAIEYLKIASKYDVALSAECMYIIISCYLRQNNKTKAIEVYKELIEKFPFSLQVFKSQQLFENYKINIENFTSHKLLKTNFYFTAEYGYDSNINMVSLEQFSGDSDNYYGIMFSMSIDYKKFSVLSTFEKVLFSSYSSYSSDMYNLTLKYNFDKFSLGIFGNHLKYQQPFNYELGGDLKFTLQPFSLKFLYSNGIYLDSPELNTTIYQATGEINHTDYSYKFLVGLTIRRNLSEKIFTYYSIMPSIKFSQEILKFLTINTSLNYEVKKYDWKREDILVNLNFSISITPFRNMELLPSLLYTDCSSNLDYLSYQKTDFSVSLNLYF